MTELNANGANITERIGREGRLLFKGADTVRLHPVQKIMTMNVFTDIRVSNPRDLKRTFPEMTFVGLPIVVDRKMPEDEIAFLQNGTELGRIVKLGIPKI